MRSCILFVLGIFFSISLSAQSKKITGTVTDELSKPLPGVEIIIAGLHKGYTDFDGNYEISVAVKDTLEFAYIGYVTAKIAVENSKIINPQMKLDGKALEEVIVTFKCFKREKKVIIKGKN